MKKSSTMCCCRCILCAVVCNEDFRFFEMSQKIAYNWPTCIASIILCSLRSCLLSYSLISDPNVRSSHCVGMVQTNVQEFLISHYSKPQMYFGMGLVEFTHSTPYTSKSLLWCVPFVRWQQLSQHLEGFIRREETLYHVFGKTWLVSWTKPKISMVWKV